MGLPEGYLPMAETAIYLALAPKSNSAYRSYARALADARETRNEPVPLHLRNAVTRLMRDLGYGRGYRYAHDFPGHRTDQQDLPERLAGRRYYEPGTEGLEPALWERWKKGAAGGASQRREDEPSPS